MTFDTRRLKRAAKQAKRRESGGFVVCELNRDGFAFAFASAAEPFENRSAGLKWLRRQTGGEIADFDRSRIGVGSLERRDGRIFLTLDSVKSVGNWNKGVLKDAVKAAYKVADVKAPQMKTKVGNFKKAAESADQAKSAEKTKPADKPKPERPDGADDLFDSISEAAPGKAAKKPSRKKARPGASPAKKKSAGGAPDEEKLTEITVKASLGIISRQLAELILSGAPAGSWLIRFDESSNLYVLASKFGSRVMHRPTTSARGAKTIKVTRKKAGLLVPGRGPLPLHVSMSEEEAEIRLDRFGKWLVRQGEGGKRIISLNIGGVVRHSAIGSIGAVKLVRTLKLDVAKAVLP